MNASWLARVAKRLARRRAPEGHNGPGPRPGRRAAGDTHALAPHFDRVYLLRSVERTLQEEVARKPDVETGGVLVGFTDSRLNAVVVTAASGPGPRAVHGRYRFNRDAIFCQKFLDEHAAQTGGVVDFVGEWHKHPEPHPWPSGEDAATYRKLAIDPLAHVARPLVLIVGTQPGCGGRPPDRYVGVNAFVFRADGFEARPIQWRADDAYGDLRCPPSNEDAAVARRSNAETSFHADPRRRRPERP